jgi:hypothetical protein
MAAGGIQDGDDSPTEWTPGTVEQDPAGAPAPPADPAPPPEQPPQEPAPA